MYQQRDINGYFDLLAGRLPGESLAAAASRGLRSEHIGFEYLVQCLIPWRKGDGISGCKLFLPTGTPLRHVCAKCGATVRAQVVGCAVEFENGDKRASLEQAKRSALWRLSCDCRRQGGKTHFSGRSVLEFWELLHRDRWERLSTFRMPWD